jgi:lipopolysaccharide transport system ATP-binding protein
MKDIILKVENVSKQYRLGQVGTGTLSHDLNRWWHQIRGKEDPYLKVGDTNDRTKKGDSEYVWALQDINFEVERGEILGIIGKNGAGKSTLLKILSKVTTPTTGSIKSRGRIASLLEVGTGFNPELTGRENIYLNGAILGMTKKEITEKLPEIIEFSGCERYIDTPTKRYSSGMTVRLAFAVAAFLEPEILVVDEVLAVGDAEFQKKAIGKMQDISKSGGRTVFFVSHNMAAVKSLCNKGIVMQNGQILDYLPIDEAVQLYLSLNNQKSVEITKKFKNFRINQFTVSNKANDTDLASVIAFESFKINIEFEYLKDFPMQVHVELFFKDEFGVVLTSASTWLNVINIEPKSQVQKICFEFTHGLSLVQGVYNIDLQFVDAFDNRVFEDIKQLEVLNTEITGVKKELKKERFGFVYAPFVFSIIG